MSLLVCPSFPASSTTLPACSTALGRHARPKVVSAVVSRLARDGSRQELSLFRVAHPNLCPNSALDPIARIPCSIHSLRQLKPLAHFDDAYLLIHLGGLFLVCCVGADAFQKKDLGSLGSRKQGSRKQLKGPAAAYESHPILSSGPRRFQDVVGCLRSYNSAA